MKIESFYMDIALLRAIVFFSIPESNYLTMSALTIKKKWGDNEQLRDAEIEGL